MQTDFETHHGDLVEQSTRLPSTIEELIDFVIVGNEAIQSFKAKLKACNKADLAFEAKEQALRDGRKISRLVLDAETRLGELLSKNPRVYVGSPKVTDNAQLKSLPVGINKKESHYAQEIYKHPEIVEEVFTKKQNDIPTRHDILKAIKHKKVEEKIEKQKEEIKQGIEQPDGLYDLIVIDPPWNYGRKYDADGARVANQYPEMTFEELEKIKLPAKDNCILWCWTTHQFIYDAIELLEKWNFEYKCILTWDKEKMGIGKWLRLQTEFCLLGIRGKPLWENKGLRDIIREPRTKHSVKPECFYQMIDENFVGKKLDYFGRNKRKGWDIYGAGQDSI